MLATIRLPMLPSPLLVVDGPEPTVTIHRVSGASYQLQGLSACRDGFSSRIVDSCPTLALSHCWCPGTACIGVPVLPAHLLRYAGPSCSDGIVVAMALLLNHITFAITQAQLHL